MRHTILKAYALAMCILTASILGLTASGPLWEGITDLLLRRATDSDLYRFYTLEPLCEGCTMDNEGHLIPPAPKISAYHELKSKGTLMPMEPEVVEPMKAPLLPRLGIALLAALVGFNHWRLFRYLSQPLA